MLTNLFAKINFSLELKFFINILEEETLSDYYLLQLKRLLKIKSFML